MIERAIDARAKDRSFDYPMLCAMVQNRANHSKNCNQIIHLPTSEGVSEVSERTNEQMDERVAQYLHLDS